MDRTYRRRRGFDAPVPDLHGNLVESFSLGVTAALRESEMGLAELYSGNVGRAAPV
jgi:hypothetical protein